MRTRDLATVMDTGSPELCLGPIAESYPPQCGGPPLTGWDWADHEGTYDEQGEVRWGTYAVTGTWDGTSFAATEAVPGALYDPAMPTPTATPSPATAYDTAELESIAAELQPAPGVLGAFGGRAARVTCWSTSTTTTGRCRTGPTRPTAPASCWSRLRWSTRLRAAQAVGRSAGSRVRLIELMQ